MSIPYKILRPIRLIELFAGYGSQLMALKRLERERKCNVESWLAVEVEPKVINTYNLIHGTTYKPTDIRNVHGSDLQISDTDKFTYICTYSFPCQDLSVAGHQRGMSKGSNTRSGLLWEVERILNECVELPQILMMENVTQIHNKKNIDDFNKWIEFLKSKGYTSIYQDLNSCQYGIPQNRNRTFMISILGEYEYEFPKPIPLTKCVLDLTDDDVPESYYLPDEILDKLQYHEC